MASGTQKEIKTLSVYFWESGDISRPNDDAVIGQRDLIVERDATGELALLGGECGVSITNQDFVCLLWGKAEVRVAHYPLGTQK